MLSIGFLPKLQNFVDGNVRPLQKLCRKGSVLSKQETGDSVEYLNLLQELALWEGFSNSIPLPNPGSYEITRNDSL